jgi:hypothetical protein
MTALQTPELATHQTVASGAVVWINGRQAMVATMSHNGTISTCEIDRGVLSEPSYLSQVVRAIGDRQRVVVLGPSSVRLALEREYVSIFLRPDRLVDVEPANAADMEELVDRLRTLVA